MKSFQKIPFRLFWLSLVSFPSGSFLSQYIRTLKGQFQLFKGRLRRPRMQNMSFLIYVCEFYKIFYEGSKYMHSLGFLMDIFQDNFISVFSGYSCTNLVPFSGSQVPQSIIFSVLGRFYYKQRHIQSLFQHEFKEEMYFIQSPWAYICYYQSLKRSLFEYEMCIYQGEVINLLKEGKKVYKFSFLRKIQMKKEFF
ncbi:hypothetical protein IMG5_020160 [Ichthyophthirius multifiliis]|uniref:Uncharacterized protein n=1 Tax=Ichthyophthirius multifiliis TaxID=5932 RepID=G0QKN4_ICHMU|nr:hypothetical protein IMG5_020160 [Ichthyophthirius multifiliis]EGR34218.1 hypothetical protein IMG5_020160 [Ichthyophthirius multifiliis]|eukprot:XP_004039522.1 hypothetical protein IMG5_020160 [Ichthyophthirius multifiliis]